MNSRHLCPVNSRSEETIEPSDSVTEGATNRRCKGCGTSSHGRRNYGLCQAKTAIDMVHGIEKLRQVTHSIMKMCLDPACVM
ncbi:hypothetical protein BC941DRAFT_519522 [Chlamydoabsidia padenii]|nr:hypothetical protein BC941DRAFT_519522 [Chlamydoabsidia padenii]